jgi:copper(I)-binding protein
VDTHKTEGTFHFALESKTVSGGITVDHAWSRATPPNASSAAAYVTLTDPGQPDILTGASTPVAATAEVHETTNDGGIMKMRPVGPLPLDPGKPVTFAPGGYHIMLTGLKQPLKQGDHFPLTLTFAHAAPVTVQVAVAAIGSSTEPMDHTATDHGGMDHGGMDMGGMKMGGASK